jgi:ribosomal protein S18 acetylase RimI-like enzyme
MTHFPYLMIKERMETLLLEVQSLADFEIVPPDQVHHYVEKICTEADIILWTREVLEGFVAFYCNDPARGAFITMVVVRPESRKKGIAKALVSAALTAIQSRDFKQCGLRVHKRNIVAANLYRSLGFEDAGEDGEFIKMERTFVPQQQPGSRLG